MTKAKQVMTVKDIAEYLDMHPMTIYKFVKEGRIPAFKVGTSWRIKRESIQRWIKEREHSANEGGKI
ncbi:MAG: helix-turn-helix domain-containing protein [Candidatus Omnitrophica bacterium]|nr:helix-turn-helix domain-containing protein [Candidatus Omnitrophota bacterium]